MGSRVLVTGGAGFIGSHIAERLLASGHEVAVLDDLSSGKRDQVPARARFYELDIRRDLSPAFAEFRPECVVHEAAQVSVSYSVREPMIDAEINILGSIRLLLACREYGVRKVVYASSAAAYGPSETLPLGEDLRPRPVSCYGASKYTVEHYLRTAGTEWGIEWAALRYSNVYGPRQDPHGEAGVVAIFANLLLDGKAPTIFGGGELTRDYVYVEDVAEANRLAVEVDLSGRRDPVFNVSTGVPTSTNRVFELLENALGTSIEPIRGPHRPGDVQDSVLDSTRFREATGWAPRVSIEEGFQRTAAYFRERAARS